MTLHCPEASDMVTYGNCVQLRPYSPTRFPNCLAPTQQTTVSKTAQLQQSSQTTSARFSLLRSIADAPQDSSTVQLWDKTLSYDAICKHDISEDIAWVQCSGDTDYTAAIQRVQHTVVLPGRTPVLHVVCHNSAMKNINVPMQGSGYSEQGRPPKKRQCFKRRVGFCFEASS